MRLRETQVIDLKYVTMDWPRRKQLPISSKETVGKKKEEKKANRFWPLIENYDKFFLSLLLRLAASGRILC